MVYFIVTIVFMYVGRMLGWAFSRPLYTASLATVVIFGIFWGVVVAGSVCGLIFWQEPGWILRWVMGYALGAYVSIPNYGLVDEATVPDETILQHVLLKLIPWVTYIASSIALAFLIR